jgi:DNA polymerase I
MDYLTFDVETEPFRPGCMAPPIVAAGHKQSLCKVHVYPAAELEAKVTAWLKKASQGEIRILGHNVAFDMACVVAQWPHLKPLVHEAYKNDGIWDTLLMAKLYDLANGELFRAKGRYSLDGCAQRFLGVDPMEKGEDSWQMRWAELQGVPQEQWPEEAVQYLRQDVQLTHDLGLELARLGDKYAYDFWRDIGRQSHAAFGLRLSSNLGMCVDGKELARQRETNQHSRADAITPLQQAGILRANGTKDQKAVRALVEAELGNNAPRTPTGAVKTTADILAGLRSPAGRALVQYRQAEKLESTYYQAFDKGVEAPLHTTVNALLENGRTSNSNPNLQNIPPEARRCFVPRPGHYLVSCDYSGAELRTFAQALLDVVGWSKLAELFQSDPDADPHLWVGAQLLGISGAEAAERLAEGDPRVKKARQQAKAANFGFPGGMGIKRFVATQAQRGEIYTEEQARRLKEAWMGQWPEVRAYFDFVTKHLRAGDRGTFRCLRSGRVRGGVGFCDGANNFFSALAADGAKSAIIRMCRRDVRLLAWIHDEALAEVPIETAHKDAMAIADDMIQGLQEFCPDVPIVAEPALMKRWDKNAVPAYDEAGQLVPWEAT